MSALVETVEHLKAIDMQALKSELEDLHAIREWALASLRIDYRTGDRVEIVSPYPSNTGKGWACYSEALAVGQTGVAGGISFNRFAKGWYVLVGMDRSWSTHERWNRPPERFWNGPADECPEGYTLPGGYPPEGKVKYFSMPVAWVSLFAPALEVRP